VPRPRLLASSIAALAALAWLSPAGPAAAARYSVTDLGTLGGEASEANAINAGGEVAGTADTEVKVGRRAHARAITHAFRYSPGAPGLIDLGPSEFEPMSGECVLCSEGFAINDAGDVAGMVRSRSDDLLAIVFETDGTRAGVPHVGFEPEALGINDAGQVVGGGAGGPEGPPRSAEQEAWLSMLGGEEATELALAPDMGPLSLGGIATAINDHGEVVGTSGVGEAFAEPPEYHAFRYGSGRMHDLGTLGGHTARAMAINDKGTAVGYSTIAGDGAQHAFRGSGKMTDLGTLPGSTESRAYGINGHGVIVGSSGGRAFVVRHGSMADLNALIAPGSGWVLTRAAAINEAGEIAGTGLHAGVRRAFLLKPPTRP
jgi:probable HAF family extracellular repeat protein